jgi:hypothetical protein
MGLVQRITDEMVQRAWEHTMPMGTIGPDGIHARRFNSFRRAAPSSSRRLAPLTTRWRPESVSIRVTPVGA